MEAVGSKLITLTLWDLILNRLWTLISNLYSFSLFTNLSYSFFFLFDVRFKSCHIYSTYFLLVLPVICISFFPFSFLLQVSRSINFNLQFVALFPSLLIPMFSFILLHMAFFFYHIKVIHPLYINFICILRHTCPSLLIPFFLSLFLLCL